MSALPAFLERTYPGVDPQPAITAPLPLPADAHEESLRLLTFVQSRNTSDGVVAPFPSKSQSN